jgi:probable F420-dependent oxidoreductase
MGTAPLALGFVPRCAPGSSARDFAALVQAIEALGAASLWAPGHIASGREVPEAITGLARLAALTERATVGTAVLLAPLYHPVIVAKQLAELDRQTQGRVALGVGVGGEYESEFRACQVPMTERGARADEAITVMRRLWCGAPCDNSGRFWPFSDVSIDPPPHRVGGPPIVVAGRKPPAMRRAARAGDGWMPFLYSPAQYRASVETIRAEARAAGRDLDGFSWMCFVYVSIDADGERARRRAAAFIGGAQAGDGSRFAALVDKVAVAGTPTEVTATFQSFVDAGARHFIVLPCDTGDHLPTITSVMREIAPTLELPG